MICMSMGYPSHDAEVDIAKGKSVKADEYTIKPVMNAQGLVEMQERSSRYLSMTVFIRTLWIWLMRQGQVRTLSLE